MYTFTSLLWFLATLGSTLSKATSLSKIRIPIWFQSGNEVVLASAHSSPEAASKDLERYEVRNCTVFSEMADIEQYEELKEARVKRQTQNSSSWHQRYVSLPASSTIPNTARYTQSS